VTEDSHRVPPWRPLSTLAFSVCLLGARSVIAAEEVSSAQTAFFESKIRPVLVAHCYRCHSVSAGKSEGGLSLDSRQALLTGGDRGPAVVPGDAKASLLLTAISHSDPDLKMPPKKDRLPAAIIDDFRIWIEKGATDPRVDPPATAASPPVTVEAGRQFWSNQKPVDHRPPATSRPEWAKRPLDHFVLAQLETHGLTPTTDAEPEVLLRRLHFDLVGLPPSPAAMSDFREQIARAGLDAALERQVDELLASPQYGERWGRHWLDVARFAESSGKEANVTFPYAWRYRDYVIDAFNDDLPYDRFLTEQIAGDLLPAEDAAERAKLLIATGFLAIGPKNLDEANAQQFEADLVDEQIDALTRAVIANSVACARCHDHKFDPFAMEDYYALAGVFRSTKTYFGTFVSPTNRLAGDPLALPREAGLPVLHASVPADRVVKLKEQLAALQKEAKDGQAAALKAALSGEEPEKSFTLRDALRIFWTSGGIEGQLEKVDDQGQALPLAMGVLDRSEIVNASLLERGEIDRPAAEVPRAFPRVIEIAGVKPAAEQSGRLEFAQWLTHPDHPLTSRVIVNRVWQHLFGTGLVRTVDNFGFSGERPSHPELLDHLSVQFMAGKSSMKTLVRELVLSRTYRQASTYREEAFRIDPENRWLWRASKRRLDAEAIRDAMLAVGGELDKARPVGSLVGQTIGDRPVSLLGLDAKLPKDLDGTRHRSVYLPIIRDRLPDVLDLFDFAEPSLVTGEREITNVPVQALYLMNSPFVQERALALAEHLQRESSDNSARIDLAFRLCFSRPPDAEERRLATAYFEAGQLSGSGTDATQLLAGYCQALLSTAEFRNLD